MRTQSICLAMAIVLLCPVASAQWGHTNCPMSSNSISMLTMVDSSLYAGAVGDFPAVDGILLQSRDKGNRWDTLAIWPNEYGLKGSSRTWDQFISVETILVASLHAHESDAISWWYTMRSTDGGHTWTDTALTDRVVGFVQVRSRIYLFESWGTILSSANRGETWDTVKQIGLSAGQLGSVVSKDSMMFCGTLNNGIFRSTSLGESWVPASVGLNSGAVLGLEAVGDTVFCLIMGMVNGFPQNFVFRSTDDGKTWSNASSGLSGSWGNNVLWSYRHLLFTATTSGLFVSRDRGDSWHLWGEGVPFNSPPYYAVNSMAFSDGFAFASLGGSVWRRPLSEITTSVQMSSSQVPHEFNLFQNYPNPFNPVTTIKFELPRASQVNMTLFDMVGREVSVLVNERRDAGVHEVKCDGSNVASGVYFYRLQAEDFNQTKRLVLVK